MAKKTQRTILVTGATGKQGSAVIHHLRKRGFSIRALTRDPEKPAARALVGHGVDVVRGDLTDPASLTRALEDLHGVYSVQDSTQGAEAEIRQGINLVDAANRSRVSHLVYSSVGSADQNTGIPHFDSKFRIEEHIRGAGIPYTIFRPVFFMDNWLAVRGQIEQGNLTSPLSPQTRLQMIAVDDIGAFVAMAFEHAGRWQGRSFDIAGDDLSMTEIAQALGRAAGREVQYRQAPWDRFGQQVGHDLSVMYRWFEDVGYHVDIAAVRQELPALINFERWLKDKWQPAGTKEDQVASGRGAGR